MSPSPSAPAVEVVGARKAFGATQVLHGVDLVVPADGVTAILGPSGCGKTTLLRLIAGFEAPDAGVIRVDGRPVAGDGATVPPQRRGVGYVPQEGALFPHLTVAGNITFGLSARRRRERDRVAELLELVGLPVGTADRYPHQLSGGQQQRVALARALAPSPALVLLDEPFASLDAGLREETRRATGAALAAACAAAVLVTHDQDEALSFATHVAVMREGRIVQSADPRGLYAAPADVGVARFVGAAVVLPGVVRSGTASCALGSLSVPPGSGDGPVQLLVRPEQVLVHDSPVPGSVGARVLDVAYYGHDGTAQLLLADDVRVTARTQGARLPAPGTDVHLTVDGPVLAYPRSPIVEV